MFLEFFPATLPQILSLPSNSQPDRKKKTQRELMYLVL